MIEHTRGPWRGGKCRLHFEGGRKVWAVFANGQTPVCTLPEIEEAEANVRRIVACVNYCEGVSTEEIEAAPAGLELRQLLNAMDSDLPHFVDKYDALRKREHATVEALRAVLASVPLHHSHLALKARIEALLASKP